MRKLAAYIILGVLVLASGIVGVWLVVFREPPLRSEDILAGYNEEAEYASLTVRYPFDDTLFPPESIAPTFRWEDGNDDSNAWLVTIKFQDGQDRISSCSYLAEWTPSDEQWSTIKQRSLESDATVTVLGVSRRRPKQILSGASISIRTSNDEVGAPLFYREVHLPFAEAVTDPGRHIRWRFGTIDTKDQPPIVMENLPVCGNCHSFSADGAVMGMDVDYANDKGSYAVGPVAEEMTLDKNRIITWSDYQKEDETTTFGLLSQVSPDGRYVVSTVKDRSVFVSRPDLAFSQLFFPIRGILVCYDRETKTFRALSGADDPQYVQSNPVWSPDGKYITFAKHEAYDLKKSYDKALALLDSDDAEEFTSGRKTFKYDLYRIPFNDGKGGKPEPLEGASNNGMSNYFPKYSPDGKWIVFCKAQSFMLLQPDSELYIVPAEGGEARRMRCNTTRMNSWHSWSPNGRWLAFSSKAFSPYTQLFLTHIDEQGRSTPPMALSHFTESKKAANIPEFVNLEGDAIAAIRHDFLDDNNFFRAGVEALRGKDFETATRAYRKALELNPEHLNARNELGITLMERELDEEAATHFAKVIELSPEFAEAHRNLGNARARQGQFQEAIAPLRESVRLDPDEPTTHLILGKVFLGLGQVKDGKHHIAQAARLDPELAEAHRFLDLADSSSSEGKFEEAVGYYRSALGEYTDFLPALLGLASVFAMADDGNVREGAEAVKLGLKACELTRFGDPEALFVLSAAYAEVGQFQDAVKAAERGLGVARATGDDEFAETIQQQLELFRQLKPCRRSTLFRPT